MPLHVRNIYNSEHHREKQEHYAFGLIVRAEEQQLAPPLEERIGRLGPPLPIVLVRQEPRFFLL